MKKILISGGSGLIGNEITRLLKERGNEVAWLSRSPENQPQKSYFWNPAEGELDHEALYWCDGIIHLAGAGVADKRWTKKRKKVILDSRVLSSRLLYQEINGLKNKPKFFITSSGVSFYGMDSGDQLMYEGDPAGEGFLADLVKSWEAETDKIQALNVRTVILRIGIVLSKNGGALQELLKPPITAPLGNGDQYMSWIHINDLAEMFIHAVDNHGVSGIYNAVGPVPVSNKVLTKKASTYRGKPYIGIGVPDFALKLALGEMAEMVLGGNRVSCEKMQGTGFKFKYGDLNQALAQIFQ
ncbi:MAG: TIGR01777 family oxidoreductase [Cyclobacteriaceae bacterium]